MGRDGGATRARILDATIDAIREGGLTALRIQEIARRADTSTGLVVYHFASIDGVIAAAMERSENAYYDALDAEDDPTAPAPQRLRRIIERSADPDSILGQWTLWMELWVRALRDEEAARLQTQLDARWRGKLLEAIEQGVADGVFDTVDPRGAMLRLSALLDGLSVNAALGDPEMSAGAIAGMWFEAAARELGCDVELFTG